MRAVITPHRVPLVATTLVGVLLYAAAALAFPGFGTWGVFVDFLRDNAVLGLAAIGMTFVILSGGIDLSVGAMVGFSSVLIAQLTMRAGWHPGCSIAVALLLGTAFGAGLGTLIHVFRLPPFLVTLGGMFLARGAGFVISLESITIRHPCYQVVDDFSFNVMPLTAVIFVAALMAAIYVAHWTPFGRAVYAIGGSEPSAVLMGLPVGRTKVAVYAVSGLCSAGAGAVCTFYTASGNASAGTMLELDAIAAVVMGGTLLSGGVGHMFGTLLGVLIYGVIQTALAFQGTLSSWWTRIAIGALLLAFILLQRLVQRRVVGKVGVES